jgi:hypothetical protein
MGVSPGTARGDHHFMSAFGNSANTFDNTGLNLTAMGHEGAVDVESNQPTLRSRFSH